MPDEISATTRDRERPPRGYRLRLLLARGALAWERIWPSLWPPTGIAGLFLLLLLFDVLPLLPGWLHLLVLLLLAAAFLCALFLSVKGWRLPGAAAARRRLERDSGLAHRPLEALEDRLASDREDSAAAALWAAHRRRLLATAKRLRLAPPAAGWARVDPLALRSALGLLLLLGLLVGAADWRERAARALTPTFGPAAAVLPTALDLWVDPPTYTGIAPLYLDSASEAAVVVPSGSRLLAQVSGGQGAPELLIDERVHAFEGSGEAAFKLEIELAEALAGERALAVQQGGEGLAGWTLRILPDLPPHVELPAPPRQASRGALHIEYQGGDDYGVTALTARIARQDRPEAEPIELELLLPPGTAREIAGETFQDLTPHPWAGIPVTLVLQAVDAIGQTGQSEAVDFLLPERIFNHPVARLLAALRKELTLDPGRRMAVAAALAEIEARPAHYGWDTVVALALSSAERRLVHDRRERAIGEVQKLLWDTAIHLEEGEVGLAERQLRELQRQLQEALANDASDEEIERLMNELKEALDRFLQALAEQAQQQMQEGNRESREMPSEAEMVQREDLQRLLDQAREMARSGARDQARELLAELQRMLENLQAMPMMGQSGGELRESQEMMRQMEELMRGQQELLDRSFQRSQRGEGQRREPMPGEGDGEGRDPGRSSNMGDAQAQEALRRQLGELMRRYGDLTGQIPRSLGNAEQSMRSARDALEGDLPGEAIGPQADALDQLQQGLEAMLEDLSRQLGDGRGEGGTQQGLEPGESRDPFGRGDGRGRHVDREGVEIPEEGELQRAREILDEIRRRRSDPRRPTLELDYFDRLLRQF